MEIIHASWYAFRFVADILVSAILRICHNYETAVYWNDVQGNICSYV